MLRDGRKKRAGSEGETGTRVGSVGTRSGERHCRAAIGQRAAGAGGRPPAARRRPIGRPVGGERDIDNHRRRASVCVCALSRSGPLQTSICSPPLCRLECPFGLRVSSPRFSPAFKSRARSNYVSSTPEWVSCFIGCTAECKIQKWDRLRERGLRGSESEAKWRV